MMMRIVGVIIAILVVQPVFTPCYAEPDDTAFFTGLYAEHRATAPGDILFVVISETSVASYSASRSNQKSSDARVGPGAGWLDFIPEVSFRGQLSAAATGQSQLRDSLAARVAVVVTGLSPTGNLLIEGERAVRVNGALRTIRLRGEVRPEDVRPDNTVLSHLVAHATIEYEGPDPGRPGRHVGILTRILGWLF